MEGDEFKDFTEREVSKGLTVFEVVFILAFIISSLAAFYAFSLASIDLWGFLTTLFSMTINMEEITSMIISLIPFSFLFPIPFAIISFYGIIREKFNIHVPLVASIITVAFGLMIYRADLIYLLFSIGFVAGSIVCGYWSHTRFKELKSSRVYRASTRSASRAYVMIKLGIVFAIFIVLVSDESRIQEFMDSSIDSYSALSMKLTERQMRSQIEGSVKAQKDVQKEMYSELIGNVANVYKLRGIRKLEEVKNREDSFIDRVGISESRKSEIKQGLGEIIDEEKVDWSNEADSESKRLITQISDQMDNESYQQQMVEEYEEKLKEEILTEDKVKGQISTLLKEPVDIEGREVVMYDFIKTTFPLFVIFILWGIMGIWRKLIFAPLVGIYSLILSKVFMGGKVPRIENEIQ